jgi:glucan phosphorylase
MAQKENRIINSWSFLAFAGEFGKVINRQHWTPAEGAPFETLSFRESKDTTKAKYVHFSKQLGELSNKELKDQMGDLQVVELKVDPEVLASRAEKGQQLETYKLCKKGQIDFGEEIDLF